MYRSLKSRRNAAGLRTAPALVLALAGAASAQSQPGYTATPLVDNVCCDEPNVDANMLGVWGVTFGRAGAAWTTIPKTGKATLHNGLGVPNALVVTLEAPAGDEHLEPTGVAANPTTDFVVSNNAGGRTPAAFLFATNEGTINAWTGVPPPGAQNTVAVIAVDHSVGRADPASSYSGVAVAATDQGSRLFAADPINRRIDVFDGAFGPVAAAFVDRDLPANFAPFNVRVFGGAVYVAYVLVDDQGVVVPGQGLGIIDRYKPDGSFDRRIATGHSLNAPWGMAVAPANFGPLAGGLLVANTGDGTINAWDALVGTPMGPVIDQRTGRPIVIDGLIGVDFGNGGATQQNNALFYTASKSVALIGELGRIDQGCPADVDGNGLIEPADIASFVGAWNTSIVQRTLAGDFDGNNVVTPADVSRFVAVWFGAVATGC